MEKEKKKAPRFEELYDGSATDLSKLFISNTSIRSSIRFGVWVW